MQHNEPGREPTEPTDAELLRDLAESFSINPQSAAWYRDRNAALARGREYLSGARPMPDKPAPDEVAQPACEKCHGEGGWEGGAGWYVCDQCGGEAAQLRAEVARLKKDADLFYNSAKLWEKSSKSHKARVAELEAELAALREGNEIIVGHSETRGGWCVYEQTGPGEYEMLKGPFQTCEEAEAAMRSQAAPGKEPTSE